MRVSVALATYNGEKYILEQLDSVFNQTLKPDEVIISDDHSTDKTKEIVDEYIKSHGLKSWKLIDNERNGGVADNFINAVCHTTGDILFLCDQDDIWENDKIQTMVSAFDSNTSCVISAIRYVDQAGKEIKKKTSYTKKRAHEIDLNELCSVCSYLGMSAAFLRTVYLTVEEALMLKTSHDWALMVCAEDIGKIKYIGEPLQRYRQHSNNVSIIKNGSRAKNRLGLIERQLRIINITNDFETKQEKKAIYMKYLTFLNNRTDWISRGNALAILAHIHDYKKLRYSLRNIVADVFAAIMIGRN